MRSMSTALDVPLQLASSNAGSGDDGLAAFLSIRSRLFGIAYRMLGSATEAEDVVQNVWIRWQTVDRSLVRDAAAFLVTAATRLAINARQSARSRRETHVDSGLPEPVDTSADSRLGMERGQALASGFQLLLERLTPKERAAYILREAFDYPYRTVANVLRLEEANARQVVARARQHLANGRRKPASATGRRRLLDAFVAAAQDGDVAGLARLLASDAGLDFAGAGSALATIESAQRGKDIDHEARHHRRHRAHRFEARGQADGRRSRGRAGIASHGRQHPHRRGPG